MSVTVTQLMSKWLECTGRFDLPPQVTLKAWTHIATNYLSPKRHYHNFQHIQELLEQMAEIERRLENPLVVALSIFFHDVIYDATAKDNEEQSAAAFRQFVAESDGKIPTDVATAVDRYIMQTKNHMQCPSAAPMDLKYFLDMDVAILGADKERYMQYMAQIREEYIHLPHDVYGKGRTAVLKHFLAQKRIYQTPYYYEKLERTARSNMSYEVTVLGTPEVASSRLTITDIAELTEFVASHSRPIPSKQMDDMLVPKADEITHAVVMNMDMCIAYQDSKTKSLITVLICTRTSDPQYSLEARSEHNIIGNHVLLHTIVTHRERRGKGLASALLSELLVFMRESGCRKMSTWCWQGTKQEQFFKKQGFQVVREIDLSPAGGTEEVDSDDDSDVESGEVSIVSHRRNHFPDASGDGDDRGKAPPPMGRTASFGSFSTNGSMSKGGSFRFGSGSDGGAGSPSARSQPITTQASSVQFPMDHALVALLQSKKRVAVEMSLTL